MLCHSFEKPFAVLQPGGVVTPVILIATSRGHPFIKEKFPGQKPVIFLYG
jgi:hypothetical protein